MAVRRNVMRRTVSSINKGIDYNLDPTRCPKDSYYTSVSILFGMNLESFLKLPLSTLKLHIHLSIATDAAFFLINTLTLFWNKSHPRMKA
jgi:hypothetical protein